MVDVTNALNIWKISWSLAKADFKLRNEGTYLGVFWYILNPLLVFGLLLFLFTDQLGDNIRNYAAYLFIGIIIFNFFQNVTVGATGVISTYSGLIKSINFSRNILVFQILIFNFFCHLFEVLILILFLVIIGLPVAPILYYIPVFFCLALFTLGAAYLLAAIGAYFADLGHIWIFISRLFWFATPIFYSITDQPKLLLFNYFNPLYYFVSICRDLIIYDRMPSWQAFSGLLGFTALSLIVGVAVFNRLQHGFAETV